MSRSRIFFYTFVVLTACLYLVPAGIWYFAPPKTVVATAGEPTEIPVTFLRNTTLNTDQAFICGYLADEKQFGCVPFDEVFPDTTARPNSGLEL